MFLSSSLSPSLLGLSRLCALSIGRTFCSNLSARRELFPPYRPPFSTPHLPGATSHRRCLHGKGPIKALPVPDGKFDILFFGGDEFSCRTLQKLEQAKGQHGFHDSTPHSEMPLTPI